MQKVSPFLPLCCFSSIEDKPMMMKSSFVWAKVLEYLEEKKDFASSASTSFLLRGIVWMKRMHRFQYFPPFPPLKVDAETRFEEMKGACLKLPSFRLIKASGASGRDAILTNSALYKAIQLVSQEEFFQTLHAYFEVVKEQCQENPEIADITNQTFYPYAKKLVIEPNVRRIFRGDMHGDILSFVLFIDQLIKNGDMGTDFSLLRPIKLFFLGDFVDRGVWGLEVIYLLMQLKIKNPDSVYMVRGNHEDPEMADRLGFYQEYRAKFGDNEDYKKLSAFYHSLPVVLYLGISTEGPISFIQCCHGGMEWGYNPQNFLNDESKSLEKIVEFKRLSECSTLGFHEVKAHSHDFKPITPKQPFPIGFMWSEFNVGADDKTTYAEDRKVFSCSQEVTLAALTAASLGKNVLKGVIRAHQHAPNNPLMKLLLKTSGCVKLWEGTVTTLLLTPDSDSGLSIGSESAFTYDTTLEMTGGAKFEDMDCKVINNDVYTS